PPRRRRRGPRRAAPCPAPAPPAPRRRAVPRHPAPARWCTSSATVRRRPAPAAGPARAPPAAVPARRGGRAVPAPGAMRYWRTGHSSLQARLAFAAVLHVATDAVEVIGAEPEHLPVVELVAAIGLGV